MNDLLSSQEEIAPQLEELNNKEMKSLIIDCREDSENDLSVN